MFHVSNPGILFGLLDSCDRYFAHKVSSVRHIGELFVFAMACVKSWQMPPKWIWRLKFSVYAACSRKTFCMKLRLFVGVRWLVKGDSKYCCVPIRWPALFWDWDRAFLIYMLSYLDETFLPEGRSPSAHQSNGTDFWIWLEVSW